MTARPSNDDRIPRFKRPPNSGPSQRQRRVSEIIRHALAEIFKRKNLRDPFFNSLRLTVTEVTMGGDLKTATVYMFFPPLSNTIEILAKLKQAKNEIRAQLSNYITLKFIPDLLFKHDTSLEYGEKIDILLRSVTEQSNKSL